MVEEEKKRRAGKPIEGLGRVTIAEGVITMIAELAQQIQETVARRVEEMTGLQVSGVDVYVQGVQFPQEEGVK